jgi:hypothetical protein
MYTSGGGNNSAYAVDIADMVRNGDVLGNGCPSSLYKTDTIYLSHCLPRLADDTMDLGDEGACAHSWCWGCVRIVIVIG